MNKRLVFLLALVALFFLVPSALAGTSPITTPTPTPTPSQTPSSSEISQSCNVLVVEGIKCSGKLNKELTRTHVSGYKWSHYNFGCTRFPNRQGRGIRKLIEQECRASKGGSKSNCLVVAHSLGAVAAFNYRSEKADYMLLDPPYKINYGPVASIFSASHRAIRRAARRGIANSPDLHDWTFGDVTPKEDHTPWDYDLGFKGVIGDVKYWIRENCPRR